MREYQIAGIQEFLHVVETFVKLFLEALEDELGESRRHVGPELPRVGGQFLHVLERDFDGAIPVEGQLAACHFVQDNAHAVNVGLDGDFVAVALLWAHVLRRSHRHARLGEVLLFHLLDVRDAKIHDVHAVVVRNHDV